MRAASLVVLVTIVLPLLLSQFWAYQLGLYGLYAVAAVGVGLCLGPGGIPAARTRAVLRSCGVSLRPRVHCLSGSSAHCRSCVAGGGDCRRRAGLSDRHRGLSASRRERRLFLDDYARARLLAFQIATAGIRSPAALTASRAFQAFPAWMIFPTSIMSRPPFCWPCWRSAAGSTCADRRVLARVAQNERRLQLFGFDTDQLKSVAFGVSGLMAGTVARSTRRNRGLLRHRLSDLVSRPIS